MGDMIEWIMEATYQDRFPFRLWIVEDEQVLLCLRTQDKWPGAKGQIFCLRDDPDVLDARAVLERERVVSYRRIGKRLVVAIDRPQRKRCDFLFLTRPYKNRPGSYEQIFFRTEGAVKQHRSRGKRELYGRPTLSVLVDKAERYPWSFPGAQVRREPLPVGDYALEFDGRIAALVERKTFENMLHEVAQIRGFHQQLADLARFPRPALVIEAQYADFTDPKRLEGRYSGGYVADILAEIASIHPGIQIIFAGTRKHAAQWTHGFFTAEAARRERLRTEGPMLVAERPIDQTRMDPRVAAYELRAEILARTDEFRMKDLTTAHPELRPERIRRVVNKLREEGRLASRGRASGVRYRVVTGERDGP